MKSIYDKRPSLIPAILAVFCSLMCYSCAGFWPAVVIAVMFLGLCFFLARSKGMKSLVVVGILFSLLLVYSGCTISKRLNACTECGEGEYLCTVTDITYDLSGDIDVIVKLESGAYAKARFYDITPSVEIGDVAVTYGKLREPDKAGNPGELDYREYLRSKGILYVLVCDGWETVESASFPVNIPGFLKLKYYEFRRYLMNAVTSSFDGDLRAVAFAVCTGDKSLIDDGVRRDFKLSCCSHLLAVSGTHFSGFLACLPALMSLFKINRKKGLVLYVFSVVVIGCLTGWSESVTRAAVMSICLFADRDWLSALSLASLVMVIADPFCPLSSGFQMSFCAVIAIKVYGDKISGFLVKIHFPKVFAGILGVSISASLGMIPFWSDISMRPDILHLLIQIAASFVAQTACVYFIPCVFLCLLFPFLSEFLAAPLSFCLELLIKNVSFGSSVSEKGGYVVHLPKAFLVVFAAFLFLLLIPPCLLKRVFLKIAAVALAVMIGFEVYGLFDRPQCTVVFADVGQGDCCLIITPDSTCLIDGGTYKEGSTTVNDLLDYYGIFQVDYCIMSHWDTDHAGGIAALHEQGRVDRVITSFVPDADSNDKDVYEFFDGVGFDDAEKTDFVSCLDLVLAGDRIELSDSVYLDALYPVDAGGGGNEDSLVLMLHIVGEEKTSILFTGDIGFTTESFLLDSGIDIDCDVLKVAHHGSKYSSSAEFIEGCSPSLAVISVGRNNFYGHPAPDTLERLESYGCEVFRTDEEGAVVLEY